LTLVLLGCWCWLFLGDIRSSLLSKQSSGVIFVCLRCFVRHQLKFPRVGIKHHQLLHLLSVAKHDADSLTDFFLIFLNRGDNCRGLSIYSGHKEGR
jgi:hypothetical protein